jgi:hypothetical protein
LGTENYVALSGDSAPKVRVLVETLDAVLRDLAPVLMKVDVEGYESAVFSGALSVLAKDSLQAMVVERTGIGSRYGFDEGALHRSIQDKGFVPCAYSPLTRDLRRLPANASGNIIYLRDVEGAQQRLRAAEPFRFGGATI